MPRNVYFSQAVKSEQNLYEDLIIESLGIYGQDVYYIPRTLVNRDNILNEDPASKFDDAYLMEMYIENTEGFEGAGDLYSKFGLEIRDEATFVVSRRRWDSRIGVFSSNLVDPRPQEGDLIFLPMTNSFFEISYVEDDSPFYQLSNLPVYKMQCSLFEFNDEEFDTGVAEIDTKTAQSAYQLSMDINITGGNHYEVGETVRQTISDGVVVFGEVVSRTKVSDTNSQIYVANIGVTGSTEYKTFIESNSVALVGDNTEYIGYINAIYDSIADTTSGRVFSTDEAAQNMEFEIDADGFIDFSESNPFGDPSETY
jgi:hypothetical protein